MSCNPHGSGRRGGQWEQKVRFREEGAVWVKASGKMETDNMEQVRVKGSVVRGEPKEAAGWPWLP